MVTAGDISLLGIGAADLTDYVIPATAIASTSEARPSAPGRRLVNFSETTATYDARGNFPSLRIFQVARPQPDYRPYGDLVKEMTGRSAGVLLGAYAGRRETNSGLVDRLA